MNIKHSGLIISGGICFTKVGKRLYCGNGLFVKSIDLSDDDFENAALLGVHFSHAYQIFALETAEKKYLVVILNGSMVKINISNYAVCGNAVLMNSEGKLRFWNLETCDFMIGEGYMPRLMEYDGNYIYMVPAESPNFIYVIKGNVIINRIALPHPALKLFLTPSGLRAQFSGLSVSTALCLPETQQDLFVSESIDAIVEYQRDMVVYRVGEIYKTELKGEIAFFSKFTPLYIENWVMACMYLDQVFTQKLVLNGGAILERSTDSRTIIKLRGERYLGCQCGKIYFEYDDNIISYNIDGTAAEKFSTSRTVFL